MKSNLFRKGTALILSISIMQSISVYATELPKDNLTLSDSSILQNDASENLNDYNLITDEEMKVFNEEYKTKEEAEAEIASSEYENQISPRSILPTSPSTAYEISATSPYFIGNYTLNPGQAGYIKLTTTGNINLSCFTTGSTDTYIEVYSNPSCTNLVTSNDDNGHGANARVYFYTTGGQTYYIKIKGYSNSTSGAYTVVLHRGQPTSRYEKSDMFSYFNSTNYQRYNNCYTYALGYYVNPVTGQRFNGKGVNPGGLSGNPITMNDLSNPSTFKTKVEAAMQRDCNYYGGDFAEITSSTQPRQGYYKVALVLDPGNDYHWYRQLSDGKYGHKPGNTSAILIDASGYYIWYPKSCNRAYSSSGLNYSEFIGYYEVKTPTGHSPVTLSNEDDLEVYSLNNSLSIENITALNTETTYKEAMEVLGAAHDYIGSGMVGNVYNLIDGTKISVYFANDKIDQIRTINNDGTFDIIVQ